MIYRDEEELFKSRSIEVVDDKLRIKDLELFRDEIVDNLHDTLIFSDSAHIKKRCHWVVNEAAREFGIIPSSIQSFYEARAKENLIRFTVPAINLRTLTFDLAKAVFRAAKKINAGAFVFEIARSEIGYTCLH